MIGQGSEAAPGDEVEMAPDLQRDPGAAERIAFVDSSALVALADAGDATHRAAVAAYDELRGEGYRFFTTNLLLTEAYELIAAGPGPVVAATWLAGCRIPVYFVDEKDLADARRRLRERDLEPTFGLMNALSLSVIARFGVQDVFAVDQAVLRALG